MSQKKLPFVKRQALEIEALNRQIETLREGIKEDIIGYCESEKFRPLLSTMNPNDIVMRATEVLRSMNDCQTLDKAQEPCNHCRRNTTSHFSGYCYECRELPEAPNEK